jgi:hypothetical protein
LTGSSNLFLLLTSFSFDSSIIILRFCSTADSICYLRFDRCYDRKQGAFGIVTPGILPNLTKFFVERSQRGFVPAKLLILVSGVDTELLAL